jgi:hypothetical protein
MVRPDEIAGSGAISGCIDLAGASPAGVIAGEPCSRLPTAAAEMPYVEAQRRKPHSRRKQAGGPQREVNAEQASSQYQPKGVREGRAGHTAAKARDTELDPERSVDLSGVLAAARLHRSMWNRRDPSRRLTSSTATTISAEREMWWCRAGVRGGRSTEEGADNALEGRAPASVGPEMQVSVRAWS